MSTVINGLQARRYAVYGRTAGAVLLVSAVSLWALEIPGMNGEIKPPAPPAAAPSTQPVVVPVARTIDTETVSGMATRFDLAVKKAPVPDKPIAEAVPPEPRPETPPWQYLGCIREADRTLAMVSVEGHQKIIAQGKTFGETKLISVSDQSIQIEVSGVPQTVNRAERTGGTVAWVRNMASNAAPVIANVNGMPGGPGQLTPEVRERLANRGINPDQAQQWRNARGGRNGNGNGGGRGPGGQGGRNGVPLGVETRINGQTSVTITPDGEVTRTRAVPATDQQGDDASGAGKKE